MRQGTMDRAEDRNPRLMPRAGNLPLVAVVLMNQAPLLKADRRGGGDHRLALRWAFRT